MAGAAAVLSSLGMRRRVVANPWSALTSPADFTSAYARAVVAAMRRAGVTRVVAVSAAGVGDSAPQMNATMRFLVATSSIGAAYRDLARMEQVFADSGLDWLAPRPTRLTDGPATGRVRVIGAFGMFDAISRADVAGWMVRALDEPVGSSRTPQITG
jgi:purine nucleoside phosphorylase